MSIYVRKLTKLFTGLFLITGMCLVEPVIAATEKCDTARYTFSWSLDVDCALSPRGGTSTGTSVTLSAEPNPGWLDLQKEGLSNYEKDRLAILAMAGEYRTSFEFLEVVGYTQEFERSRPYQSWSTEVVYVVEDKDDLISLQHIIVMFVKSENGEVQGPFVQKHWRQDWQYEKSSIMEYVGNSSWQHRELSSEEYQGAWAQSVFQVDDSPRYESVGTWQHYENFSTWVSGVTWRPLPRRESSVRSDYQVLEGTNRHTILPSGWVHEEENLKLVIDTSGRAIEGQPYLSKELGVNRYELIEDFDFSAGDDYWQSTGPYWSLVRNIWAELFSENETFELGSQVNGVPLFAPLFQMAEESTDDTTIIDEEGVRAVITPYMLK